MYLPGFGLEHALEWPSIEVTETQELVRVEAPLPGFEERDVKLSIEGRHLTIAGERPFSISARDFSPGERFYGCFERRVVLAARIQEDRIAAALRQGVLRIVLPKRRLDMPKRIAVDSQ